MKTQTPDELFTALASQHLGIDTLVERRMDSLDFHDVGVVGLRRALQAAYEAGLKVAEGKVVAG